MGANASKKEAKAKRKEAEKRSAMVDKQLAAAALADMRRFKILILGAGESGKSTILKQVKSNYQIPLNSVELASVKFTIKQNTLQSMNILITALADLKLPVDSKTAKLAERFLSIDMNEPMSEDTAALITKLWDRKPIQSAWKRRSEFWYLDAAEYYFEHSARFAGHDYEPTEEDIIRARIRTTGITVTEFTEGDAQYSIVDVGGQRSERRKWIHHFDDVKCVLFVINLNGYNQVMFEDSSVLRMQDSLQLFEKMASDHMFKRTQFVICLNKKDLFEAELQRAPLSNCFPEFEAVEERFDDVSSKEFSQVAVRFIRDKFIDVFEKHTPGGDLDRSVEVHVISATSKSQVRYMVEDIHVFIQTGKSTFTKKKASEGPSPWKGKAARGPPVRKPKRHNSMTASSDEPRHAKGDRGKKSKKKRK